MVIFDFLFYAGLKSKTYPLFVWDFGNAKGNRNLRAVNGPSGLMTVPLYGINLVTPENDVDGAALVQWDNIEAYLKTYLVGGVDVLSYVSVANLENMPVSDYYYPGMLSVEREMGVLYNVDLKIWC